MTPENQRDENLKKAQAQLEADRFRAKKFLKDVPLTPLRMAFMIEQLVCDYNIIRQSWEAEKKGLEERVLELEFVPGHSECPKCGFYLVQSILHPGGISPDKKTPPQCPNDGTEMISVRWMKHCQNMQKGQEAILERAVRSEEELTRLKSRNEELEKLLEINRDGWDKACEEGRRLEALNEELERRIVCGECGGTDLVCAKGWQEERSRLKAENEKMALGLAQYVEDKNRLTASLSAAHEVLKDEEAYWQEASDDYAATIQEGGKIDSELASEISKRLSSIVLTLSDPSGKLALERWRRMDAVIKSVRRHLENGTVVTEERMAGCLSELEALDASEGGSDV